MNFPVISGFIDRWKLWDRTFKEYSTEDIKLLADCFIESACYPGDQVTTPKPAKCLVTNCVYCLLKPDKVVKGVLFCGYDGRPVFDLYYSGGCPLKKWKSENKLIEKIEGGQCLTSTIKTKAGP